MKIAERVCIECNSTLKGRSDKRFCDDGCRNNYNNRLNSNQTSYVRTVNAVLRKNRKILMESLTEGHKVKVDKTILIEAGFQFDFFTHQYKTTAGKVYIFVYEYGYLPLKDDQFLLVKKFE
ncbi:hypothetical protein HMPREF0765_0975 [Sphingobacterium spiritivorum ATCC 33300]|uniref:DUF2116 family Zn-ribbon domain-containing protein n=1 Tax=Sphingobacterium spiritivorum ATCC 33300 TaxID=525372 RepID=C2FUG9_SPHSI|nr:hypothetical protein [Sphingobacterium spiritivorum]EEI93438.1 hypothetical protein HMPREF0765_0975 [Sphingobacterium spiritivorum ATCC 33300]QQS95886.1 hypothetical protein I6J03_21345 [Sphingobacterium spiritivorum]